MGERTRNTERAELYVCECAVLACRYVSGGIRIEGVYVRFIESVGIKNVRVCVKETLRVRQRNKRNA